VRSVQRQTIVVFAVIAIALGLAMLVRTAAAGGGVGYLFGALFIGLGAGRLYLLRRR
jgi:hypothetical protein